MYKYDTAVDKLQTALRILEVREDGSVWRNGVKKVPEANENGYLRINYYIGGKRQKVKLHRLIIAKFKGLEPNMAVNHIDGDKTNNHIDNLEYCELAENIKHYWNSGVYHPRIKLNMVQAANARLIYKAKKKNQRELAEMYGVTTRYMNRVINNKYWASEA